MYILVSRASDVPEELLPVPLKQVTSTEQKSSKTQKTASSKEWMKWLFTDVELAPPATTPSQVLLDILEAVPAEILESVSSRSLSGLRLILQGKRKPTVRTLEAWSSAITLLSNRWIDSSTSNVQILFESLVKLTADLLRRPRYNAYAKDFVGIIATNIEKDDRALQGITNGLKKLFQTESGVAVELMRSLAEQLPVKWNENRVFLT